MCSSKESLLSIVIPKNFRGCCILYYVHTYVIEADWLDFIGFVSIRQILKDQIILPFSGAHTQVCKKCPACECRICR